MVLCSSGSFSIVHIRASTSLIRLSYSTSSAIVFISRGVVGWVGAVVASPIGCRTRPTEGTEPDPVGAGRNGPPPRSRWQIGPFVSQRSNSWIGDLGVRDGWTVRRPRGDRHRRRARHRARARADAGRRRAPRSSSTTWAARWTARAHDVGPPSEVVDEIEAAGRRGGGQRRRRLRLGRGRGADRPGGRRLRPPRRAGQQRRHPARPHAGQHDRGRVGRGDQGAPEGHLRAVALRGRLLARAVQGRARRSTARIINTSSLVGHLRQRRPDQLRRGQGRHRRLHHHRLARSWPATA